MANWASGLIAVLIGVVLIVVNGMVPVPLSTILYIIGIILVIIGVVGIVVALVRGGI